MKRKGGRPRAPEGARRVRLGEVWAAPEQAQRIREAARRLTGGNIRAFLLVAAVERADAVLKGGEETEP